MCMSSNKCKNNGKIKEMMGEKVGSPIDEVEEMVVGGGERKGKKGEGISEEDKYLGRGRMGGSWGVQWAEGIRASEELAG